jgi:predicted deacylase
MAEAYGIKWVVPRSSIVGGTYGAAAAAGIPAILTESGQVGQLDEHCVQVHLRGCRNVLKLLGALPGELEPTAEIRTVADYLWVRANQQGCWYSRVTPGQLVETGQVVGVIKDFFGNPLEEYKAPGSGVVLFSVTSLAITEGDPLLAVGVL